MGRVIFFGTDTRRMFPARQKRMYTVEFDLSGDYDLGHVDMEVACDTLSSENAYMYRVLATHL